MRAKRVPALAPDVHRAAVDPDEAVDLPAVGLASDLEAGVRLVAVHVADQRELGHDALRPESSELCLSLFYVFWGYNWGYIQ